MGSTVRFDNVSKSFEAIEAVRDLSLSVEAGEFVVLVGPSGCGKTTALRMVAGLETISAGEVRIADRVVNDVPPKDRNVAMVFQNYALYPHMTVAANLGFNLKLKRESKAEIRKRVEAVAASLAIDELLNRKPHQLSGGQKQRVAIGRALVRDPEVFLFDEPLSNLDAKLRVQMRLELARMHRELEATMLYVTHDQIEAMTLADRMVVMDQGQIQQLGAPLDVFRTPCNRFVAEFIGSPGMNMLDGKIDGGEFIFGGGLIRLAGEFLPSHLEADNRTATLGVRPQHLSPHDVSPAHTKTRETERCLDFDAQVEVVEPMGTETFLHIRLGDHQLVARTESNPPSVGESLTFTAHVDNLHWFDSAGRRAG